MNSVKEYKTQRNGGSRRLVWLPKEMDVTVVTIAEVLGMSISGFIRFCVLLYFEQHSVQTVKINAIKQELVEKIVKVASKREI